MTGIWNYFAHLTRLTGTEMLEVTQREKFATSSFIVCNKSCMMKD